MSTRSRIGVQNDDGTITSVYCHWDGGIWHVGKVLNENYRETRKIKRLFRYGDISGLGKDIGRKHLFENPFSFYGDSQEAAEIWAQKYDKMCTFYGRDRGENDVFPVTHTFSDYLKAAENCGAEYIYLWKINFATDRKDWFVRKVCAGHVWHLLKKIKDENW